MQFSQPVLKVDRFADCLRFYRDLLGMELLMGDEKGPVASLQSGGQRLTLLDAKGVPTEAAGVLGGPSGAPRVTLAFFAGDVDAEYERLRKEGVEYKIEPRDFPDWGVRSSVCLDPDGNPVEIAATLQPKTA